MILVNLLYRLLAFPIAKPAIVEAFKAFLFWIVWDTKSNRIYYFKVLPPVPTDKNIIVVRGEYRKPLSMLQF